MRRYSVSCIVFFCLFILTSVLAAARKLPQAQQTAQSPPSAPVRDPQAITILNNALGAMGGLQALSQISDLTVTGQFTDELNSPPDVKITRTYIKGLNQVRMETDTPSGTSVVVYANGDGFQIAGGEKQSIRTHSSVGRSLEFFPVLCIAGLLQGPSVSIEMGTSATLDGKSIYEIKASHFFAGDPNSSAVLSRASRVEFFIDKQTLLPIGLRYFVHADSDSRIDRPMDIRFSNFETTNGLLMPFAATQALNGRTIAVFTINSIVANHGLLDSLFQ